MTTSRAPGRSSSAPDRRRLLDELPEVFLGPDALAAFDGRPGLLVGEKRHGQVDVFGVAREGGASPEGAELVRSRLDRSTFESWRIVGVALPEDDLPDLLGELLDGLVPGDLVVVGADPARVLIHRGDGLSPIRDPRAAAA